MHETREDKVAASFAEIRRRSPRDETPTQSFPALLLQRPQLPRAVCCDLRQRTDYDGFHGSEDLARSAPTSLVQPSDVNQLIWLVRGDVAKEGGDVKTSVFRTSHSGS